MNERGRRTAKELKNVSTADMTSAEYRRSDDGRPYTVVLGSARYQVVGIHSARVVAGKDGKIEEGHR